MNGKDRIRRSAVLAACVIAALAITGFGRMFLDTSPGVIGLILLSLVAPTLAVAWPGAVFGGSRNPAVWTAPVLLGLCAGFLASPNGLAGAIAGAVGGLLVSSLGKDLGLPGRLSPASFAVLAVAGTQDVFVHWHGVRGFALFVVLTLASLGAAGTAMMVLLALRRAGFLGTCLVLGAMLAGACFRLVHDATVMQIRAMVATVLVEFVLLTLIGARDVAERVRALPRSATLSEPLCTVPLLDRKKDVAVEAHVD